MDLALLGVAARRGNPGRDRALGAIAAVAAIAAADVAASVRETAVIRRGWSSGRSEAYVEQTMAVNKSAQECYEFWRNLANHPKFSRTVQSVTPIDDKRSHWVVKGPTGATLEWDSEITSEQPGQQLSWRSLEGSTVMNAGTVRFEPAPGARGTFVRVSMHYQPPGGRVSAALAKLMGHGPASEVREDLRRFKALLETGEIPSTEGQPAGRRSVLGVLTPEGRKAARSGDGQFNRTQRWGGQETVRSSYEGKPA